MKISACLVIRNEERVLKRCLESIKEVVDEIIIVHDGPCKDKSLEIAKHYNCRIFTKPLIGIAEPYRPFSYEKAAGDWILQIDADEYLSEIARKEISKLISDKNIDAYSFSWPYFKNGEYIRIGPFSKTLKSCLFRKNKLYILGIAQEYPRTYGVLQKRSDILLEHKPKYDNFNKEVFREKWVNWAKLHARQITNIEKAAMFNISVTSDNKIIQHYIFMRQHPLWTGLKSVIKFTCIYIFRGILWSGWTSIKIAYFDLAYKVLLAKYLEYLKYGRAI